MANLISPDLQTSSSHLQLSSPSHQSYPGTVSCTSNTSNHNGVLINRHPDLIRNQSYSPSKLYLTTNSISSESTLMSCARQSQMASPLESKPVMSITSDGNPCSVDSLSQSSTPAIMSLAISSENDYNPDSAAIATNVDEAVDSCKGAQTDFAWIKEKKSTRKQHQGLLHCSPLCDWFTAPIITLITTEQANRQWPQRSSTNWPINWHQWRGHSLSFLVTFPRGVGGRSSSRLSRHFIKWPLWAALGDGNLFIYTATH